MLYLRECLLLVRGMVCVVLIESCFVVHSLLALFTGASVCWLSTHLGAAACCCHTAPPLPYGLATVVLGCFCRAACLYLAACLCCTALCLSGWFASVILLHPLSVCFGNVILLTIVLPLCSCSDISIHRPASHCCHSTCHCGAALSMSLLGC